MKMTPIIGIIVGIIAIVTIIRYNFFNNPESKWFRIEDTFDKEIQPIEEVTPRFQKK